MEIITLHTCDGRSVCTKLLKNASSRLARAHRGFIVNASNERALLGCFTRHISPLFL